MELLTSKKFKLPTIYFITNRKEIKELPIGIPFIYGDESVKDNLIRILEYEILYQRALATGLPFNFKKILEDEGYAIQDYEWCETVYVNYSTSGNVNSIKDDDDLKLEQIQHSLGIRQYINDAVAILDIQVIKNLNIFPIWLDNIEEAVKTNIHNFSVYNPNMYNKKLDGMYGSIELTSPKKNLFIFDISRSIPKGIGSTFLAMGKYLGETFYADILITGRKSVLIPYEELHTITIDTAYKQWGNGQENNMFKKLLTSDTKQYGTVICYGDNNHPGDDWHSDGSCISDEDGKKLCRWAIDKLISLHTEGTRYLAGYSRWFDVEEKDITRVNNWIKYLK